MWTGRGTQEEAVEEMFSEKRCGATAKAVGAGDDDEEDGGLDDAVGDAGASCNSTAPPPSMTARMQAIEHELQRFTLENGIDDGNDNDDESTGEDDLSWWCRHQFAYTQPWLDWPTSI